MKRIYKIALIFGLAVLATPITVYAASVLTLSTPASVTVVLGPGLTMHSYTGTPPSGTCNSQTVSSIPYNSVPQRGSSTVYECLSDTGGTAYYITSSSFATDLSSSIGTVTATYYVSGSAYTPPIYFTSGTELVVGFDLTVASNAAAGGTDFNINVQVFSTSSG